MVTKHELVQRLPNGPLDVIGDIHGELDALLALLKNLGYDERGQHRQDRHLVFVGDLCDRGPDSVGVIQLVKSLVDSGRASSILGNHEINLLRNDAKDGSGWYFDERVQSDERYQPFRRPSPTEKREIYEFLETLPLVLERDDLRVVHAAWQPEEIEVVRNLQADHAHGAYDHYQRKVDDTLRSDGRHQRYLDQKRQWHDRLEDHERAIPFLEAIAEYDAANQAGNPIRVLTSGVERVGDAPFFSSHKWRFVNRVAWWDEYDDSVPVIVGHYWRMAEAVDRTIVGKGDAYLFEDIATHGWHGKRKNVFCVDYSVGGRWRERGISAGNSYRFKLAAMRWPERELVFDTGERVMTLG